VHRSFLPLPGSTGPYPSAFATGGSAIYRRSLFLELGGFDPIFAPFYMEDVELSYRAWKRGYGIRLAPSSVVRHRFSSTIAAASARRIERTSQRNRIVFNWIHLHDRRFLASHACWLAVLLISSPVTFKFGFLHGFASALRQLPDVRARRRTERARSVRSDRQVLDIFNALENSGTVVAYDDRRELEERVAPRAISR
jgi:GT2 family glycosyltransferase